MRDHGHDQPSSEHLLNQTPTNLWGAGRAQVGNGRGREGHADVLDLQLSNKDYMTCHSSVAGAGCH